MNRARPKRVPGRRTPGQKSLGATVLAMILLAVGAYFQYGKQDRPETSTGNRQVDPGSRPRTQQQSSTPVEAQDPKPTVEPRTGDDGGIARLYRDRKSNVIVTASGTIAKILPDDTHTADGSSRHQRFIIRLPTGDTVLMAHNIDLSPRIPAAENDFVRFKGEYEWTDKGGVVHWTHKDPRRRHPDGWIEHNGKRYE